MKNARKSIQILLAAIPIMIAWASLFVYPKWLIPFSIVLLFLAIMFLPCTARRQDLYMFVLSVPLLAPINLRILYMMRYWLDGGTTTLSVLLNIFLFFVLMSAEVLVLQYFTRIIWKRQYNC